MDGTVYALSMVIMTYISQGEMRWERLHQNATKNTSAGMPAARSFSLQRNIGPGRSHSREYHISLRFVGIRGHFS